MVYFKPLYANFIAIFKEICVERLGSLNPFRTGVWSLGPQPTSWKDKVSDICCCPPLESLRPCDVISTHGMLLTSTQVYAHCVEVSSIMR